MKVIHPLLGFNRGLVSRLALARVDLKRMGLSAETQTNWMPRVLGSMMLRPGTEYIGATAGNAACAFFPFVFATDDTALVELTDVTLRVWIDDELVTRDTVTSGITNGTFTSDVSSWTDADEAGATSVWATGGYLSLTGTGTNSAIRRQQVTVSGASQNKEHGLAINVFQGVAKIRIGSSAGGEQYIADTVLRAGYHSLAFTPTGDFHIQFSNATVYPALVSSIAVESAGAMTLTTPITLSNLQDVRVEQSGDVLFTACDGLRPMRIERQDTRSWSCVEYAPEDGPFRDINTGTTRISASAISGSVTLTATAPLFASTNVGSLYRLSSAGQQVSTTVTAQDTFTSPIRVTGTGTGRTFSVTLTAAPTFTATTTVRIQRSVAEPGDWVDITSYTAVTTTTYNDALDNQVIYYRIGVKTGEFTALDGVTCALNYTAGSITGIARVTAYTSSTAVTASVLTDLGGTASTDDWSEGAWSDRRGWPTSVALFDGRLWWAGKDNIWGSISDSYDGFDDATEGDSGPITRTIGSGPVDKINWLIGSTNLLLGSQGAELVAKSSSLDEPLTPTAFSLKPVSTLGSNNMQAVKVDTSCVFVNRNGSRVYELAFDGSAYNYVPSELTAVLPEIGLPSFVRVAVQRQPDTRIHFVRSDGVVAILVFDKLENVTCWVTFETDGTVEDVVVLPGTEEDNVYYVVLRTINGLPKRYLERWSLESEAQGGATCKLMDASATYSGVSTSTISGLNHLEGESVVVWGNSKDLGTYTVTSSAITLSEPVTLAFVGLPYTARFKSAKLAIGSQAQSPLTQRKRIDHLGLILADTHYQGLRYGQDFDNLDDLPLTEGYATTAADTVWDSYDADSVEVNGFWDTDARLCLEAASPLPCTVLAAIISAAGHDKQ